MVTGQVFLLGILIISGCKQANLPLTPLSLNDTILAFGDSLTEGKGVDRSNSYPAVLQALTSRPVINAGISGETTTQGAKRLSALLDETRPELLLLLEGGNDFLRGHDATLTRRNIETMIEAAKSREIPVVLIGVPDKSLFSSSADFYYELSETHDLILQDDIVKSLLLNSEMKSDSLHFNAKGYDELAKAIYALLKDNGAL